MTNAKQSTPNTQNMPNHDMHAILKQVKDSSKILSQIGANGRNAILARMRSLLDERRDKIKAQNQKDITTASARGLKPSLIDRLRLDDKQIDAMRQSIAEIIAQDEVVGEVISGSVRPSAIRIEKVRVPLGVVGMIYESRPNVTIDAAALCIKSANGAVLKGGKEARHSNAILAQIIQAAFGEVLQESRDIFPIRCLIDSSHEDILALLGARGLIDVVIPRGGEGLIDFVIEHAKVPVVMHNKGVCHIFIDSSADEKMALEIFINAKCQKPSACNACETLLIHSDIAQRILPKLASIARKEGVELRVCEKSLAILRELGEAKVLESKAGESKMPDSKMVDSSASESKDFKDSKAPNSSAQDSSARACVIPATSADFGCEFGAKIASVKVVDSMDAAIAHIGAFGSQHSEVIITSDYAAAERFLDAVDAAAVYVNASSRFSDGGEFGLGAEIGISTQKLHVRGPMGARDLTTTKYKIRGNGEIRA
ncbi:glutamate-5-semialdehyde dehydrogenase [Helicobacter sp. CLO-3]|uniref:glutamate-5-semialdehyde dehydrogenase n=1 Tax=unclassified Helicobacter TaxID=2593540 RepID=UPI0008058FE6|nr:MULTISPECIES: glutamate-5-semialdehyde dehydrogenase [unclassified Helicobacter]OBV30013.1 glutamate-5-semialdehyde dehydrogenase [Helicobacter sp. CLO-3]OHU85886.1 glutamate-5-semialdehyde dehydrogenase [Helicobacter sp. CLO-3]